MHGTLCILRNRAVFFASILCLLVCLACENQTYDRPDGWDNETHGNHADTNYGVVFPQNEVKRIDITISRRDWLAMLIDMTTLCGIFGIGGGFGDGMPGNTDNTTGGGQGGGNAPGGIPQEMIDACTFTRNGIESSGTCGSMMGQTVCMTGGGAPGGDNPAGRPGNDNATGWEFGGGALDMLRRDPVMKPCTIVFDNQTWWYVGIRFKGNSSLMSTWLSGSYKLPLRLDFDQYEDAHPEITNQRFYGFKKLTLSSNWSDNTLIREKVVADLFREAGVPAPRTAFYRVYIDYGDGPVYFGLYTMVEDPDGPMLDTQFNDGSGNLYKPDGTGANFVTFDRDTFVKKTNEDAADWSDVIAVFDALHADRSDAAAWRAGLEQAFDVYGFLQWLAVNTVITNWDTYGSMAHNYYLYNDPDDGLLHWIPWDNNMALMSMGSGGGMMGNSVSLSLSEVGNSWPLIRYLADDPVYREAYRFFVNETIRGVFTTEKNRTRFQDAHNLIEPYVVGAEGEQEGYTLLSGSNDFYTGFDSLITYAEQRCSAALQFLADEGFNPSPLVINEINYNPSDAQSGGGEFIELVNTGTQALDLSGYAFGKGMEFVFPEGTSMAPGDYALVCKNTDGYTGRASQVFSWASGKLSNRGEPLLLMNASAMIVDYVKYADRNYWPAEADGDGPSLELVGSSRVNSLAENWKASLTTGGTPGAANSVSQ